MKDDYDFRSLRQSIVRELRSLPVSFRRLLGASLLSGVVIQGHQGIGDLFIRGCPASFGEAIEHSRGSQRVVCLYGRRFGKQEVMFFTNDEKSAVS